MMVAKHGRTQDCGVVEARVRVAQARKFLETAELILDVDDDLATPGVAAALAVLSGVAASDALCCRSLGQRSRGQDHREAVALLAQVGPDGRALSRALARLLDVEDGAQYGLVFLGTTRAKAAVKNAAVLTEAAENALRG